MNEQLESVERLTKDLREAARTLSDAEARFLVDAYYTMQDGRKRSNNQVRALGESQEPSGVLKWLARQDEILEAQIKAALDQYTQHHPMGEWMRGIYGIGPVLSAGLLAHLSVEPWRCRNPKPRKKGEKRVCHEGAPCTPNCGRERIETAGHFWRFAGLDPSVKWEKGQKRPWNARLRTLSWKIGQSFMKFSNVEECFYGRLYRERKAFEVERNESGRNAKRAAELLPLYRKETEAYGHLLTGKLPPAQVDGMARRWTVKIFLSHLHQVWYEKHFGKPAPFPFAISQLGHAHKIEPPSQ